MDNINRKLIKDCIKEGIALRNDILANKYLDGEIPYLYEQWSKNVVKELSTIRKDYARALEERSHTILYSDSETIAVMFATKIMSTIEALEDILIGKDITKVTFSLKTPPGVLKTHLELVYDGSKLYDAAVPEDNISLRAGLGKNILKHCFPEMGIEHRKLFENELPHYNQQAFPKEFNKLQHSWAKAFSCSRNLIKTIIYRQNKYIHITENIRTKW